MNILRHSNFIVICTLFFAISFNCKNNEPTEAKEQTSGKSDTYKNVEKYPNGNIKIKGDIVNGIRQGKWESFYENGIKWSECNYVNGKKNGIYRTFYPNGNSQIHGIYEEDKKVDTWFFYLENGKFEKEIDFDLKNKNDSI